MRLLIAFGLCVTTIALIMWTVSVARLPAIPPTESKCGTGVAIREDGRPAVGARIRVCTKESELVKPCFPLAALYADRARTIPIANPMTADPLGNFSFWAGSGTYYIEVEP